MGHSVTCSPSFPFAHLPCLAWTGCYSTDTASMLSLALLTGTLGYLIVGNLSFKAHLGLLRPHSRQPPDTPGMCTEDRQGERRSRQEWRGRAFLGQQHFCTNSQSLHLMCWELPSEPRCGGVYPSHTLVSVLLRQPEMLLLSTRACQLQPPNYLRASSTLWVSGIPRDSECQVLACHVSLLS